MACSGLTVWIRLTTGRRYYRCTDAYKKDAMCRERYVRADALEQAVREELAKVPADPERLIGEARRV